tara:strand:- start:471 stop:995 length:525 start_codon:yes stop_codon:yes gene_type:complete
MAIREILVYPHPSLREPCLPVEKEDNVSALVNDLLETMYAYSGIGLAAPQINVLKRVFVMDVTEGESPLVFLNPEIVCVSGVSAPADEGCLSFPGYSEPVSRDTSILVRGKDTEFNEFEMSLSDLSAQCFQHELDHLNGKVFTDHLNRSSRRFITSDIKKRKKRKNLRYTGFQK